MLDLETCDPQLLRLPDAVVTALARRSRRLRPQDMMIVGAHCRDILHSAMGMTSTLRSTADIDFGKVERPPGTVTPPARRESISVWGFTEVFKASYPLELPRAGAVRIPGIAGYAALKLMAWLDRSAHGEYKDASDIAAVLLWYSESSYVHDLLYETHAGQRILLFEEADLRRGSARLLGQDIAEVLGEERLTELGERWPGLHEDTLYAQMNVINVSGWPVDLRRRREVVQAMMRGLGLRG